MECRLSLFVAVAIFGAVLGHAVPSIGAFNTGNGYMLLTNTEKGGYVIGLADGIAWAAGVEHDLNWITECIEGWTNVHVAEVFENYLRGHPDLRHKGAPIVFELAMQGACD